MSGRGRRGASWARSDRRERLPADWPLRRGVVLMRCGHRCEAEQHVPECDGVATDVDHVVRGDDHSYSNLQGLSHPCHKAKTAREGVAARATTRRPPEAHPGLRAP